MAQTPEEREHLLTQARAAHRDADRERNRARKLAGRLARRIHHTFTTARAQFEADRAAFETRVASFNQVQSDFNAASAADRDRQRTAWADLEARQKRMAAEIDETNRFQAEQAAALDARAAELAALEKADTDAKARLQREVAELRDEATALDLRARNARQLVEELEQRRAELRAESIAPAATPEPPGDLLVALDRTADRDLGQLAAELNEREQRLNLERAAVHGLFATVSAEKSTLADRRRVLSEQFAQLVLARAQWQDAERATVAEMEQLARTLGRREAELDAREGRLVAADARRRTEAYDLWQLRLRLEAWQSKLVAYEMRWHTEREHMEADFNRRLEAVAHREALIAGAVSGDPDAIPFGSVVPDESEAVAVSAELVALRDELERMAAVLLEVELPEPPDPPDGELPWGAEEAPAARDESGDSSVLYFGPATRAA